jgi:putative transposase
MPDHVHLLARLPPTIAVADFIGLVKGATSFRVNREIKPDFKLSWQEGYGALTIRKAEIEVVSRYIDNQEQHHARGTLSELLERIDTEELEEWPKTRKKPPKGG